jgi:BlaI family transcriptional regulator, penicillinase repressor
MSFPKRVKLTRFELEVMEGFWKLGRAAIREVLDELPGKKRPAYTTIQTVVYHLEQKGAVRRVKKIGNAHLFEPLISKKTALGNLISDFLELLGGSSRPLMAHLVETQQVSLEDLHEMEKLLESRKKDTSPADK